ncbi:MAG: transglycosylase domain-containing protein, partial [Anaerolineales bacterium]|nr:transglycosylase domain-containing protein [Anaerolineales bacterium]
MSDRKKESHDSEMKDNQQSLGTNRGDKEIVSPEDIKANSSEGNEIPSEEKSMGVESSGISAQENTEMEDELANTEPGQDGEDGLIIDDQQDEKAVILGLEGSSETEDFQNLKEKTNWSENEDEDNLVKKVPVVEENVSLDINEEAGQTDNITQETAEEDHQSVDDFSEIIESQKSRDEFVWEPSGTEKLSLDLESDEPTESDENKLEEDRSDMSLQKLGDTKPSTRDTEATIPPEKLDDTRPIRRRRGSASGMVLPRRVDQIDADATRVTPAAYGNRSTRLPSASHTSRTTHSRIQPTDAAPAKRFNWSKGMGCILRLAIVGLFFVVILVIGAGSFILYQYYSIAATLPNVEDLRDRAAQFETTRILDRDGNVLYEILDPSAGRRSYVPLERISPYLVAATVAVEDKDFYSHPGFDATAIVRAFWQNYQSGETVSGASTITQQLARALLFTPDERQRTYERKLREAILAEEITRRYTKDEILELYLNEFYYGNLAYGVEAASLTYFSTSADKLTLAQAAFLAGLTQAPSVYDIYTNRDVTLRRAEQALFLMYRASQEQGCIYVSNTPQRVCVDALAVAASSSELENTEFASPRIEMRYPHWVTYIRSLLEEQYDPQTIYRSGFTVHTTIDPDLQQAAQRIVAENVALLEENNAHNGALVAIQPNTGEILAMVGSADFYNPAIDGQVNMAISPRQPGSAIKPLTYTAAFEMGWTPATLIWDVPSEFPPSGRADDPRPPYKPTNFNNRFHGPVTVRDALANSYNIPAVKALDFVGIYDDPETRREEGLIAFAQRLGITTFTRDDYGLSLTLGGGEVSLLEFTGAFAVYANGGRMLPPVAITRIVDHNGNEVYRYNPPAGDIVIRAEHAFLISSILSDNQARTPMFGANSVLNLPFPAAAKTGTTNDFRDNWTMGYTPDISVGVWLGNADYTPMQNITGVAGAGPIWAEFMNYAVAHLTAGNPSPFARPSGIIERVICSVSGTEPSRWCPNQRGEIFAADQLPLPSDEDL